MTDPTSRAIAEVLRRWYARDTNVIPFPDKNERQLRQSRKWLQTYTRPIPPTTPPSAA